MDGDDDDADGMAFPSSKMLIDDWAASMVALLVGFDGDDGGSSSEAMMMMSK